MLGSRLMCSSPRLIAAYHVLHRLSMPRHPPCALLRLISISNNRTSDYGLGTKCFHSASVDDPEVQSVFDSQRFDADSLGGNRIAPFRTYDCQRANYQDSVIRTEDAVPGPATSSAVL